MAGPPVDPIEAYRRALDDAVCCGELLKDTLGVLKANSQAIAAEIDRVVGRVEGMILLECPAARRPKVKRLGAGSGP